jgi:phosphatidylserine synthase
MINKTKANWLSELPIPGRAWAMVLVGLLVFFSQLHRVAGNAGILCGWLLYSMMLGPQNALMKRWDEREVHLFHKAYSLAFALALLLTLVANAIIELNDWLHFADRQLAFIGRNWLGVMSSVLLIILGVSVLIVFRKEEE